MVETIFTWRRAIARHKRGSTAEAPSLFSALEGKRSYLAIPYTTMRCTRSVSCAG